MLSEFPIASAEIPPVRVEQSRLVTTAPATLPARSLGLGPYTVAPAKCGLPQLVDAAGNGCGLFANESLARQTAASLSQ